MRSSHDYDKARELAAWDHPQSIAPERLLFWSWYEPRNFGDWIGPYLYEALTGARPVFCPKDRMGQLGCTMSAGSILRHLAVDDRVVVWGSGIIAAGDLVRRPRRVLAVRGPLTRARLLELGHECPETYGDPAVLLPRLYRPRPGPAAHAVGFVPHFVDRHLPAAADVHVIDPTRPVESVIDAIASCRLTFSSSLHGVIVSHAYGVPCVWVRTVNPIHGDDVKFRDYFHSVGADPAPVELPGFTAADLVRHERHATLPDHGPLLEPLARSCPFGPGAVASAGDPCGGR